MTEAPGNWAVINYGLDYVSSAVQDAASGDDDRLKYAPFDKHVLCQGLTI